LAEWLFATTHATAVVTVVSSACGCLSKLLFYNARLMRVPLFCAAVNPFRMRFASFFVLVSKFIPTSAHFSQAELDLTDLVVLPFFDSRTHNKEGIGAAFN